MSVFLSNTEYVRATLVKGHTRTPFPQRTLETVSVLNRLIGIMAMAEGSTTLLDIDVEMDDPSALQPKRRRCLLLCEHCDHYLPKSTYY